MGIFGSRKRAPAQGLQLPDKLAESAGAAYGNQQFAHAFGLYVEAIDKLHTMYVVGDQSVRQPGAHDDYILTGAVNSLGAALASDSNASVDSGVQQTLAYLAQIAAAAGSVRGRYREAIESLELTLRLAR